MMIWLSVTADFVKQLTYGRQLQAYNWKYKALLSMDSYKN